MFITQKTHHWIYVVLLAVGLWLIWFGFGIVPFRASILDGDEMSLSLSVLDRFLGVPSTDLQLPGSGLQIVALPIIAVNYLIAMFPVYSPMTFVTYLENSYRHPMMTIHFIRLLVLTSCLIGFSNLYLLMKKKNKDSWPALSGMSLIATVPVVWQYATMAMVDGFALGLAGISVATAGLLNGTAAISLTAFFFAWCVASKLTFVVLGPFVLGILIQKNKCSTRQIGLFICVGFIAFMATCPYLWVDPVRFLKAILGNLSGRGEPIGWFVAWEKMFFFLTPGVFVMFVIFLILFMRTQIFIVGGASISFILLLALFAGNAMIYERYVLPLMIPAAYGVCYLLYFFNKKITENFKNRKPRILLKSFMVFVLFVSLIQNCYGYYRRYSSTEEKAKNFSDVQKQMDQLASNRPVVVFLPQNSSGLFYDRATRDSFLRMQDRLNDESKTKNNLLNFVQKRKVSKESFMALRDNFNENEKALTARFRLMATSELLGTWDVIPYAEASERVGGLSLDEGITEFKKNVDLQQPAMFLEENNSVSVLMSERFSKLKRWVFGEFTLYSSM